MTTEDAILADGVGSDKKVCGEHMRLGDRIS
jgi:hypothetical protein